MKQLLDRKQGTMNPGFYWQDELVFGQCDSQLRIRMSTLIRQLVTISSQHCRSFGMDYVNFMERKTAFVLTRATFTIHDLPKCFQHLTIKTWVDGIKGPYYQRVLQWEDEQGKVLISSRSDWVIMELTSRNLCRPDPKHEHFTEKAPVEIPPCYRIKWKDLELQPIGEHQVQWSELDGNQHLHSGNYGDIMWNALPREIQEASVESFSIEFQKEVFLQDTMYLSGVNMDENSYIVQGESQGKACFKGYVRWKKEGDITEK